MVAGRVVDANGKAVANADVATFWDGDQGRMRPYGGVRTDQDGKFILSVVVRPQALLAVDRDRRHGGLVKIDPQQVDKPVPITLQPLVSLHGQFTCSELGKRPRWTK
jgi:hypothetical protein